MKSGCLIQFEGRNYCMEIEYLKKEFYRKYGDNVHMHPSYHMILCSRGEYRAEIEGSPILNLPLNSLLFINPLVPHRFIVNSRSGAEHTTLIWRFRDENGQYLLTPLQEICGGMESASYLIRHLNRLDTENFLHKHKEAVKAGNEESGSFRTSMLQFDLCFLGIKLLMQGARQDTEQPVRRIVSRIKSIVERDLSVNTLSIIGIAGEMSMHPNYINTIFRKEEDITINKYIQQKRIELAKSIISASDLSLCEVADMTGFTRQSYFTRLFRKLCGMSPGEYRASFSDVAK